MINWQINAYDLLAIIGAAFLLYGRIVSLETKMDPIWTEYTEKQEAQRKALR